MVMQLQRPATFFLGPSRTFATACRYNNQPPLGCRHILTSPAIETSSRSHRRRNRYLSEKAPVTVNRLRQRARRLPAGRARFLQRGKGITWWPDPRRIPKRAVYPTGRHGTNPDKLRGAPPCHDPSQYGGARADRRPTQITADRKIRRTPPAAHPARLGFVDEATGGMNPETCSYRARPYRDASRAAATGIIDHDACNLVEVAAAPGHGQLDLKGRPTWAGVRKVVSRSYIEWMDDARLTASRRRDAKKQSRQPAWCTQVAAFCPTPPATGSRI